MAIPATLAAALKVAIHVSGPLSFKDKLIFHASHATVSNLNRDGKHS